MADKLPGTKYKRTLVEYEQGLFLGFIIIVVGTSLEWVSLGTGVALPSWPVNILAGITFLFLLLFLHIYYSSTYIITMLSRVPAAISSIILFTILILIMGLTKQNDPDASLIIRMTGMNHIRNSFVFQLSGLYLMVTLGLTALRRTMPFNFKNTGFAMNHAGLWIIIFAGSLGAGDVQRLNITLHENQALWYAFDQNSKPIELPFTLKLIDFTLEEYPPKIAFIERKGMKLKAGVQHNLSLIRDGMEIITGDWNIKVIKYLPDAVKEGDNYISSTDTISLPAALIGIVNEKKGIVREGWISHGNNFSTPSFINLDENYMLAMTKPAPKEYTSKVEVVTSDGKCDTTLIKVNKPMKVKGWKLYQLSYDEKLGKYSKLSVIEVIKDPWLPLIYTGIFMVLAGAFYLLWIGRNPKVS